MERKEEQVTESPEGGAVFSLIFGIILAYITGPVFGNFGRALLVVLSVLPLGIMVLFAIWDSSFMKKTVQALRRYRVRRAYPLDACRLDVNVFPRVFADRSIDEGGPVRTLPMERSLTHLEERLMRIETVLAPPVGSLVASSGHLCRPPPK